MSEGARIANVVSFVHDYQVKLWRWIEIEQTSSPAGMGTRCSTRAGYTIGRGRPSPTSTERCRRRSRSWRSRFSKTPTTSTFLRSACSNLAACAFVRLYWTTFVIMAGLALRHHFQLPRATHAVGPEVRVQRENPADVSCLRHRDRKASAKSAFKLSVCLGWPVPSSSSLEYLL